SGPNFFGASDGFYEGGTERGSFSSVVNFEIYDSVIVLCSNGIQIIDRDTYMSIGSAAIPSWDVRLRSNIIYSAANTNGFRVVNAMDYANPALFSTFPIEGETKQLELQDNILMTCSRAGGVRFWDVSVPESPELIGMYNSGNSAEDVILVDTIAYVADYYKLTVLDVSDALALAGPPTPRELAVTASGDSLAFSWRTARNAVSYKLWSSNDPGLPHELYRLEITTSDTSATLPLPADPMRLCCHR
ncbi:MAG: hypothetical protein IPP40_15610, partial [bacterium]|nr:hypothetical protein [bacterium]